MKVAVYRSKAYDEAFPGEANTRHELHFLEARLTPNTASLAEGFDAVCAFVNDDLGAEAMRRLAAGDVRLFALRSAG